MKELVLNELKVYAKEVNSKSTQGVRSHMKKLGLHGFADDFYSKKSKHPLSECSEYYLDDKDFITKAIDFKNISFSKDTSSFSINLFFSSAFPKFQYA